MRSFSECLQQYLEKLSELRRRGASEATIRDAFLTFLRDVFPSLEQADAIMLEKHIPALRVRGGFADALYGDLILEFKVRLTDQSRLDAKEELTRYIRNQQHPERYLGILTDGETLEVYALRDDEATRVDQQVLAVERAEDAKLWLDCYLFHEKHLTPTANDVALRFGERSPTFWHSLRILQSLWKQVGGDPTAQTKFVEWQSLLSIVYGSEIGDELLFLRHTYLALFARALAFVALERRAPSTDELAGIITGATFDRMGFEDFVGDDFFTWGAEAHAVAQTRALLHAVATRLTAAYDLDAIREDLLKELYQELVDPQTRHDLGEFYTPDWLAELTLRRAGFPPRGADSTPAASLFDPSCGSGTFLFTAIRLLRETGSKGLALADFCLEHLAGIDVHPLAVIIAKTNFALALGNDIRGHLGRVRIPIYMADSLACKETNPAEPEIPIPVAVGQIAKRSGKERSAGLPSGFGIPASLADQPTLLHALVDSLLDFGDPGMDESAAESGFRKRLVELAVPKGQWHQWEANLDLMRWLFRSPVTNGVWRFILKNGYQPALLAQRKFSFVVGNPPWLSYRYIQRKDYQQRVRHLIFHYGLLPRRAAHLFTQMELATLFFAFCTDHYLAKNGRLAFVMPRSILTGAKQHEGFRQRFLPASSFLLDCERVSPLFNVPACVVAWDKTAGHTPGAIHRMDAPIRMEKLKGQLPSRNASLDDAQRNLEFSETTYSPLASGARSPYWAEMTNGATIFPRCLWFVRPPETARYLDPERPHLDTDTSTERQGKPPWKGIRLTGTVEGDFLFATLLSDHMLPFGVRQFSLTVLPFVPANNGEPRLLDIAAAFRDGKPGLADWLRKAEAQWKQHRKSEVDLLDYLNWHNKLTRQSPTGVLKLIFNGRGTHLCACVIDATDVTSWRVHGLPVRGFAAENVTYWYETDKMDEAHYLCAVLNAPLVDKAIKPYQTKGAFGAQHGGGERDIHRRPFEVVPIPRFDSREKRHRRLARLSRRCHEKVTQAVDEARADGDEMFFTARIGRLRQEFRADVVKNELVEINELVADMLKRRKSVSHSEATVVSP